MKKIINWIKKFFIKDNLPVDSWDIVKEKEGLSKTDAIYREIFGGMFGSGASKDWRQSLPDAHSIQAHGDCVSFSRNNVAEINAKEKDIKDEDGDEFNFSDLDLAVGSRTSQTGNSLKRVAEYARKTGVRLEKDIPYTRNWGERNARVNATKGSAKIYKFGNWSWVGRNGNVSKSALKNALEFTPIQVGIGLGWTYQGKQPIKKPSSYTIYHAVTLTHIDEEGQYYIYDHYKRKEVILDKSYPILFAMSHRDLPSAWRSEGTDVQRFYKRMIGKYILRAEDKGQLYYVTDTKMIHVTIETNYPEFRDEVLRYLQVEDKFIGVSEKDFARLEKVAPVSSQ